MATKSSLKRFTQVQLTQIFIAQSGKHITETKRCQQAWFVNPTDLNSLRVNLTGLQFIKTVLKLQSHLFELPTDVTNQQLLQLERSFPGPYYLLKRQKMLVFEESEAIMLTLYGDNFGRYLDNLEQQSD